MITNEIQTIFGVVVGIIVAGIVIKSIIDQDKMGKAQKRDLDRDILKLWLNQNWVSDLLPIIYIELREYYDINRHQARTSFRTAMIISILGFILFAISISSSFLEKSEIEIKTWSILSSAIVEIIAGLFFVIYNKATNQIIFFHRSLLETERFLFATKIVENMTESQKDETYKLVILKILEMNWSKSKT